MVLFATLAMPLQSHAIILPRTPHVKNGYHPLLPYYLLIKWLKGIETPTTWGKIHYAKDGVHIVPTNPRIE